MQTLNAIAIFFLISLSCVMLLITRSALTAADSGEDLDGKWQCLITLKGGKSTTDAVSEFLELSGNRIKEQNKAGQTRFAGKYSIDKTVVPARIEVVFDDGVVSRGVFELRGDSLEICWGGERYPSSLDSSEASDLFYVKCARLVSRK